MDERRFVVMLERNDDCAWVSGCLEFDTENGAQLWCDDMNDDQDTVLFRAVTMEEMAYCFAGNGGVL